VLAGGADVGGALARHPDVDAVSFTGSRATGLALQQAAGLKKVLLELGGNSPNLVHGDADLGWAAKALVPGAFSNTGQSCNSVQRILVQRRVFDEVAELTVAQARRLVVGDPLDERTEVGTMVEETAAERLASWIDEAVAGGATLLIGGTRDHALFQPTLLRDVDPRMRIVCEEAFGPVAVLIPYDELDEAIAMANSTEYGLQAAVFTSSLDVAMRAAKAIRAGGIMVNRSSNFRVDNLPFGGMKASGHSREGGRFTVEEMTQRKLVLIDHALAGAPHPLSGQKH
jgi:acyl-CoA reductase-like NAD-dependent aldehyde dehydrogenase